MVPGDGVKGPFLTGIKWRRIRVWRDRLMDQDLLSKGAALYRGFNIFGLPRYTITYSLCNLSAIYLANEFKKDRKMGTELFIKLGEIGKSMDYNEAVAYMGLKSSFSEDVIREIGEYLETELEL